MGSSITSPALSVWTICQLVAWNFLKNLWNWMLWLTFLKLKIGSVKSVFHRHFSYNSGWAYVGCFQISTARCRKTSSLTTISYTPLIIKLSHKSCQMSPFSVILVTHPQAAFLHISQEFAVLRPHWSPLVSPIHMITSLEMFFTVEIFDGFVLPWSP